MAPKKIVPSSTEATGVTQATDTTEDAVRGTLPDEVATRKLIGLDLLPLSPTKPVLITDNEQACAAARAIVGAQYVVVSYYGDGDFSLREFDWTPLAGRRVLVWPTAQRFLYGCAIAHLIGPSGIPSAPLCPSVKVLDSKDQPEGWNASAALLEGWDWERLLAWAKPRSKTLEDHRAGTVIAPATAAAVPQVTINGPVAALQVNVGEVAEDAPPSESCLVRWEQLGLACNNSGTPFTNIDNMIRVLRGAPDLTDLVWYDDFHAKYLTQWGGGPVREWSDADDLLLTLKIQNEFGMSRMGDDTVSKAVRIYGRERQRNEPVDWLETLKWDGAHRIDSMLYDAFGARGVEQDVSEYVFTASKNFWIGLVARLYRPGCKVDNMLVFQGAQGIGKSRALRVIGGPWYAESNESVTTKDFFLSLQGKAIVEIAELDSFSRVEVTRIKQVISCGSDRFRQPYSRHTADYPRRCVFVGTTNEATFLRDNTGGRRFWPITCNRIDIKQLEANRDQYFAEAVHRFKAGETWYEMPSAETALEQESRRTVDEWEHIISGFLGDRPETNINDVAQELGIEVSKLDKQTQMRIGGILRVLGWSRRRARTGGDRHYIWSRPPQADDVATT